jgi:hypothetical protein
MKKVLLVFIVIICIFLINSITSGEATGTQPKWEYALAMHYHITLLSKDRWFFSPSVISDPNRYSDVRVEKEINDECIETTMILNEIGNNGWQLVNVVENHNRSTICDTYYFKRPK